VRFTTGFPISSRSDLSKEGKLKSTIKDKEELHQETIDALKYKIESINNNYLWRWIRIKKRILNY
jgi:hypothetical protein